MKRRSACAAVGLTSLSKSLCNIYQKIVIKFIYFFKLIIFNTIPRTLVIILNISNKLITNNLSYKQDLLSVLWLTCRRHNIIYKVLVLYRAKINILLLYFDIISGAFHTFWSAISASINYSLFFLASFISFWRDYT